MIWILIIVGIPAAYLLTIGLVEVCKELNRIANNVGRVASALEAHGEIIRKELAKDCTVCNNCGGSMS